MSLQPVKEAVADRLAVFAKVLELFTGGFSVTAGDLSGVTLPEGSLIKVNESTRAATVVKAAKSAADSASVTQHLVEDPGLLRVGDRVTFGHTATSAAIASIAASGDNYLITVNTGFRVGATGDILYESGATAQPAVVANSIARYAAKFGGEVTALRRGTAYKNRLQPHAAGNLADLPATIQLSDSY